MLNELFRLEQSTKLNDEGRSKVGFIDSNA